MMSSRVGDSISIEVVFFQKMYTSHLQICYFDLIVISIEFARC